jgi:hypothetical protein
MVAGPRFEPTGVYILGPPDAVGSIRCPKLGAIWWNVRRSVSSFAQRRWAFRFAVTLSGINGLLAIGTQCHQAQGGTASRASQGWRWRRLPHDTCLAQKRPCLGPDGIPNLDGRKVPCESLDQSWPAPPSSLVVSLSAAVRAVSRHAATGLDLDAALAERALRRLRAPSSPASRLRWTFHH